jgi:polyhydroxyalkanoate synthase
VNRERFLAGLEHLMTLGELEVNTSPKEEVFRLDRMRVMRYVPLAEITCPVPVVISYALINRYYMMDLQSDRSLIRNLLRAGLDLYVVDWGYPGPMDRFLSLDDYVLDYLGGAVEAVCRRTGLPAVNLLGVCQGGTLATIYTALHPERVRNLVTMVTPIDFEVTDGLLNLWSRDFPVDTAVDTFGVVPGWLMNTAFLMLKPLQLLVDKYVGLVDLLDQREALLTFLRMEKWIFDSPDQAGEAFRQFIRWLYQENRLVRGGLRIGGREVDLRQVTCPLLNIFGEQDHLVPPASSRPLGSLVGSRDQQTHAFPVGHIGMYVSSRSQKEIAPLIARWLHERCAAPARTATRRPSARKR